MNGREEHELQFQKIIVNKLLSLPTYVTEWYNNLLASGMSIRTCSTYIYGINDFLTFVNSVNQKDILPQELTPAILDQYFISLKTIRDEKGNTRRASDSRSTTMWYLLKNFFEFMTNREYIEKNYINNITRPKNKDLERINEHRVLLSKDDFTKIMNAVSNNRGTNRRRDALIMALLMTTGMRESALIEIDLQNIDIETQKLYVIDKGEKRHEYNLSDNVMMLLHHYLVQRSSVDPDDVLKPLFINKQGKRISVTTVVTTVGKYTKQALGRKLSPHKLRAGFCSILYEESHDIEFVRRAVGHSSSATTQRYIVTRNAEKEKASQIMDSIF